MTTYAQVTDGTITAVGGLPNAARRLDDGAWVLGLRDAPTRLVEACGWLPVVDTPKPPESDTTVHTRSVELIAGTPTVMWIGRLKTADELASDAIATESAQRTVNLTSAIGTLRQWSEDAGNMAVTSGNVVATTQIVVNRLSVFFDRFADLLEQQYGKQDVE